jgi:hypothetical protein
MVVEGEWREFATFAGPRLENITGWDKIVLIGDASHPLSGESKNCLRRLPLGKSLTHSQALLDLGQHLQWRMAGFWLAHLSGHDILLILYGTPLRSLNLYALLITTKCKFVEA